MSPTESARRRGPYAKTAARREQIVDEAYRLFATRGYHASSLRDVAAASGMSQSNLLHHFGSKEELLLAVLARRDALGGSDVPSGKGDPFDERIVARAEANESIPGLIALYSVLSAEATTAGHPGRDYFLGRYQRLQDDYQAEFEALRQAGRLRAGVDPAVAAASVVALWEGIQLRWLYEPEGIHAGEALRSYLDLVIEENGAGA
ncbi:TetR/AcrR family transcriptional regulator [Leifsonia sp. NPDC058230]|uniref:TetR/AcrR family transcriptional regulator n=1 Tax=Leifsonia sp. NPDC058230 TaxID=3346391 RepID=UPI0036DD45C3